MAVLFLPQDLPQGQAAPAELQTSCSSPRAAGHLPGLGLVRLGLSGDSRPFTRGAVSTLGRHVVAWWPTAGASALAASQAKGEGG